MNIILLLIPLSLVLLALGVWAFFWAVNHSQFDDLDTPGLSPLADDSLLPQDGIDAHELDRGDVDPEVAQRDEAEPGDRTQGDFEVGDTTRDDAATDAESFDDGRG